MNLPEKLLSGWGNYPQQRCRIARPANERSARQCLATRDAATWIARGLGRSYGDSALNPNGAVLETIACDHLLAFDANSGILECEAGVSLADIIHCFLPQGWFLPTTPGTKFVTVGGAIAADVHGKNHHRDGSWGNFVLSLRLATAAGEVLVCGRDQNPRLFCATLGGMGLTGCILSARIQLVRTPSCYVNVDYHRTTNLEETLQRFAEADGQYRYSVAWIDGLASGGSLGRSIVMLGNDAQVGDLGAAQQDAPWTIPPRRRAAVPCMFPRFALNPLTVAAFNALFYRRHPTGRQVVDYDRYFYPLDGVQNWNRIYGRRGFVQYQALFPREVSAQALQQLLEEITASRRASFLAVLKASGPASDGMLSFLYPGHTLALDFPNTGESLLPFIRRLDEIVLRHGGRLYLAKDALMTAEDFKVMYPRLDEFLAVKAAVDPENRFVSSQSLRLRIGTPV